MKHSPLFFILVFGIFSCASPDKKPTEKAAGKDSVTAVADSAGLASAPAVPMADSGRSPLKSQKARGRLVLNDDHVSVPPYGLEKIKALQDRIRYYYRDDEDGGMDSLDQKAYDSLSLREKFTYNMIHPESVAQMCDVLPQHLQEPDRIFGFLPDIFGEYFWSDGQLAFFKDHRDSVAAWMKECIVNEGRLGANFGRVIEDMNATEMIPVLVDVAGKETKTHYALTMLMLLMNKNKYPEFMNSSSHAKLYATEYDERAAYLVYNKANQDLIIQRATSFYNGLSAK